MNAVRIRKRLDEPIPQLPELTSWVGREVEIIVLDESGTNHDATRTTPETSIPETPGPNGTVQPVGSIDELACDELAGAFDGFEEALSQWRQEPWREGEEP